jgi:hypothetical protein
MGSKVLQKCLSNVVDRAHSTSCIHHHPKLDNFMQDLFVDRIFNIGIHQGIARMDFARLEKVDPEKKQVVFQPSMRLAMPLDAFVQMADQMVHLRDEILKQSARPDNPPEEL